MLADEGEVVFEVRDTGIGIAEDDLESAILDRFCREAAENDCDQIDRVLEIGTGSGYHAAVLSRVAGEVFT